MNLQKTDVAGVFIIEPQRFEDERGFFARLFDDEAYAEAGLETGLVQCSISFNHKKGTLRGMHYQAEPHGEAKYVRCTSGAIFDVALDLRRNSPTYLKWTGAVLSADNRRTLYIPRGCAHGFITLEDDSEVFYQMTNRYAPDAGRGVRYNDPAFGIEWPEEVTVINARDAGYPDWQ